MNMSTVSGFFFGVIGAVALAAVYGEHLGEVFHLALPLPASDPTTRAGQQRGQSVAVVSTEVQTTAPSPDPEVEDGSFPEVLTNEVEAQPVSTTGTAAELPDLTLEQRWEAYASQADSLQAAGEFPWRACFRRAAASYELPETLLLAIASGESNFDPAARSDKDAVGLMQIRWPGTSRHLGVRREADLYDPCTNVDAGARYLVELGERFNHKLHLVVAAYNYGPGRISAGNVPEGARWYSQYIYQHLQQVLGREHIATSDLLPPRAVSDVGQQVLLRFDRPHRARDFIAYLQAQAPELDLQQKSEALGHHEVVLLYRSENERQQALEAISRSGLAPLALQANSQIPL